MVHPGANKATPALNRAMLNVLNCTHQSRTAASRMWSVAPSCSLFLKKSTKKTGEQRRIGGKGPKKRGYRANRALNGHTFKALASGAAANAALLAHSEAETLRCSVTGESSKYPLLPCITKSSAGLIEAAYIAYMQEAFFNSVMIKQAFKKHKKVTQRCAQVGVDALNERIAAATSFVPAVVVPKVSAPMKKPKKHAAPAAPAAAAENES